MGLPLPLMLVEAAGQCDEHGSFSAETYGNRAPRCPHCVVREIRDRQAAARAPGELANRLLSAAGVPVRYLDARIEALGSCQDAVREWAERAAKRYAPLVVLGSVGTGKTYAAVAGLRLLCERGVSVLFGTEADYLRSIRASWGSNEITEASVFQRWASAPVLVLDDIGASRANDNDVLRVHELVAHRYDHQRTTVYISNLLPDDLAIAVGDRAYDRIRDDATQLVISGESRRKPR